MDTESGQNEHKLWLHVILRAVQDAEGNVTYAEDARDAKRLQSRARKWLTRDSKSYRKVCLWAGLTQEQSTLLQEEWRKRRRV